MTRKKWYTLIVAAVILSFGITAAVAQSAKKAEKEQTLVFQLKQLRTSVQIYVKVNKQTPADLLSAMEAKYDFGQPLHWPFDKNENGEPVDSFGNLYAYDSETAWVSSQTKGYEGW